MFVGKEGSSWVPGDCNYENVGSNSWGADTPTCKCPFLLCPPCCSCELSPLCWSSGWLVLAGKQE